jgi:hypothetical protein
LSPAFVFIREAEELARVPYEAEMNLCDNLTVYLRGLLPSEGTSAAPSNGTVTPFSGDVFQGMKLLSRDDQDYAVLGSKKGKGKKKGGNSKKETIGHGMDTLSSFSMLQITAPTTVSQIPDAIEALQQKKTSYQGIERGSVPTMAQLAEARNSKASGAGAPKTAKSKDFSLEADFPTLAANGGDSKASEVQEGDVTA